uniref:Uncharacterized protein n=1 Tax=candidate division CPR3 bacterium TaxID=2268181 RepID=A0A7C5UWC0_UNCC3
MADKNIIKTETGLAFSPEALIEKAISAKVDVGTMERLLAMRKELKDEWAKSEFFKAMAELQNEMPQIKKTRQVKNKDGTIRYSYAPLEDIILQVKGLIKKYNFSYQINTEVNNDKVKAICIVRHTAGNTERSSFEVGIDKEGYMTEPQKYASALTFAKRYAFCNAFGIMTADEDNDAVSVKPTYTNTEKRKFSEFDKLTETQKPATDKQKYAIKNLMKEGKINYSGDVEKLTLNQASNMLSVALKK